MAVKFEAGPDVKRGDLFFVDPYEVIVREELRGRHLPPSEPDIIERAVSLHDHGQIQPVECRRENGKLLLTLGFTRCAAARLIRHGFIGPDGVERKDEKFVLQVKVVDTNDEGAFIRNVVENAQRNNTSPIDDAFNQARLRDRYGFTDTAIAKLYGYANPQKVCRFRKLLALESPLQLLVHKGELGVQPALDLLELPADKRAVAVAAATAESGKVNGAEIRTQVREHVINDDLKDTNEASDAPAAEPTTPASNVAPAPAQSSAPKSRLTRSVREIRQFFEQQVGDSDQPALVRFAEDVLDFINGKKSERSLLNALERVLDAKRQASKKVA